MWTRSPPGSDGHPGVPDEPLLWLSARCISTAWSPSSKPQRRGERLYCRWSPNYANGLPPAAGSLNLLESPCPWCFWSVRGSQRWSPTKIRHIKNTSALPYLACRLSCLPFRGRIPYMGRFGFLCTRVWVNVCITQSILLLSHATILEEVNQNQSHLL